MRSHPPASRVTPSTIEDLVRGMCRDLVLFPHKLVGFPVGRKVFYLPMALAPVGSTFLVLATHWSAPRVCVDTQLLANAASLGMAPC